MKGLRLFALTALALTVFASPVLAQDPMPPKETLEGAFKTEKNFSPYAGRDFPDRVYWGDTHLHTGMSMDAGAFGARLLPEDAYRFARGKELVSSTGLKVRLSRPLDFLVVADHSDNMGFVPRLFAGEPGMLADPTGRRWYDMVTSGQGTEAAVEIIVAFSQGTFPEALASLPGSDAMVSGNVPWEKPTIISTAASTAVLPPCWIMSYQRRPVGSASILRSPEISRGKNPMLSE